MIVRDADQPEAWAGRWGRSPSDTPERQADRLRRAAELETRLAPALGAGWTFEGTHLDFELVKQIGFLVLTATPKGHYVSTRRRPSDVLDEHGFSAHDWVTIDTDYSGPNVHGEVIRQPRKTFHGQDAAKEAAALVLKLLNVSDLKKDPAQDETIAFLASASRELDSDTDNLTAILRQAEQAIYDARPGVFARVPLPCGSMFAFQRVDRRWGLYVLDRNGLAIPLSEAGRLERVEAAAALPDLWKAIEAELLRTLDQVEEATRKGLEFLASIKGGGRKP